MQAKCCPKILSKFGQLLLKFWLNIKQPSTTVGKAGASSTLQAENFVQKNEQSLKKKQKKVFVLKREYFFSGDLSNL